MGFPPDTRLLTTSREALRINGEGLRTEFTDNSAHPVCA
jgi:hypothetical protein